MCRARLILRFSGTSLNRMLTARRWTVVTLARTPFNGPPVALPAEEGRCTNSGFGHHARNASRPSSAGAGCRCGRRGAGGGHAAPNGRGRAATTPSASTAARPGPTPARRSSRKASTARPEWSITPHLPGTTTAGGVCRCQDRFCMNVMSAPSRPKARSTGQSSTCGTWPTSAPTLWNCSQ